MDTIKNEFIEHYNHRRADAALEGVLAYERERGYLVAGHWPVKLDAPWIFKDPEGDPIENDLQTSVLDLVNDLMHLTAREGLDWAYIVRRAATSYQEEQNEP